MGDVAVASEHVASHCAHTLTAATRNISVTDWQTKTTANGGGIGMLCVNSQAYDDSETAIQQACIYLHCDYQTRTALIQGFNRIRPLRNSAASAAIEGK